MSMAPMPGPAGGRGHRQGSVRRSPQLTVVAPRRQRAARVPFALVVLLVIGGGLIGLLLLNTVLAQDAFVLHDLQRRSVILGDRQQQLQETVVREEAPSVLAGRAAALGMVPGGSPLFLRLPDGKILGKPRASRGLAVAMPAPAPTPAPTPTVTPSANPSAKPSSNPSAKPGATSKPTPTPSGTRR